MNWKTESHEAERARKDAVLRDQWSREKEWHRWFAWREYCRELQALKDKRS